MENGKDFILEYVTYLRASKAETTCNKYAFILNACFNHIASSRGEQLPSEASWLNTVTKREANEYMAFKANTSASRKRQILAAVNGIYKYYIMAEIVKANPFLYIPYPKSQYAKVMLPTDEEIKKFVNTVAHPALSDASNHQYEYLMVTQTRDIAIVRLMLSSGIRENELREINLGDINFERNCVCVTRKGGAKDYAWFSTDTSEAIRKWQQSWLYAKTHKGNPHEPLFVSMQGTRLSNRAIGILFQKYSELSGVAIKPHTCRKIYATRLYRVTGDPLAVSEMLGNKDIDVTMTHYIEPTQLNKVQLAESIGF